MDPKDCNHIVGFYRNRVPYCAICGTAMEKGQGEHKQIRHPFFVYGTLREGMSNHGLIKSALGVAPVPATMKGILVYSGGLPWMHNVGDDPVHGELMYFREDIYDNVLKILDRFEGHPSMYRRILRQTEDGTRAWVYQAGSPGYRADDIVDSGDFTSFILELRHAAP